MEPPDTVVLREALRQGERILALQDAAHESVLRRGGELLRLAVAAMGGFIVVGGVLASVGALLGISGFVALTCGFVFLVVSAGSTAARLSGVIVSLEFVYGPQMRNLADHIRAAPIDEVGLLMALLEAQPDAIAENDRLIRRSKEVSATSFVSLAAGVMVLLVTFVFVLGGVILV